MAHGSQQQDNRPPQRGSGGHGGPPMRGMIIQKPKDIKGTVKRIFYYIGKRKHLLILGIVFVILTTVFSLWGTTLMQPTIDEITASAKAYIEADESVKSEVLQNGLSQLVANLLKLGIVYLVTIATSYLQIRIMLALSQRTTNEIRRDLFDKLQTLPVRYYDTNTNGDIMSRFSNDIDTMNEALNSSITSLFSSIITVVGITTLMFIYCWPLAILVILLCPVNMIAAGKMMKKSSKYFVAQQRHLGDVNGYIEEMMSGQKVVKTFSYEPEAITTFNEKNELLREAATNAQSFSGMMMPIMRSINNITYAIIAMLGGLMALGIIPLNSATLTIGGLTVFLNLARQFGRPIDEIAGQYNAIITAIAGAERVFDVMDQTPETDENVTCDLTDFKGYVKLNHVTFGYTPKKTILKDVSLYAKPGQKIAFVGSTGAGKTTVTNLISRFYEIEQGEITIDGVDIRNIDKNVLRSNISMVLQDTHLFTGTVKENIRYGRLDATDDDVVDAAKLASAHSFICRLPKGYDTIIEGDGTNLSQGQRQLLNIARAAIANTPILVLDEATSSVDTRTERHIEHGLDRLMKDKTTFIIAHRLSTVRNSNAIMVLEHGEIIERGDHDQLLEQKGRYYELYTGAVELD